MRNPTGSQAARELLDHNYADIDGVRNEAYRTYLTPKELQRITNSLVIKKGVT